MVEERIFDKPGGKDEEGGRAQHGLQTPNTAPGVLGSLSAQRPKQREVEGWQEDPTGVFGPRGKSAKNSGERHEPPLDGKISRFQTSKERDHSDRHEKGGPQFDCGF